MLEDLTVLEDVPDTLEELEVLEDLTELEEVPDTLEELEVLEDLVAVEVDVDVLDEPEGATVVVTLRGEGLLLGLVAVVVVDAEREPVLTVVVVLPVDEERVVVVVAVIAEREPDSAGAFARDELPEVAADLDALPVVVAADLDALPVVAAERLAVAEACDERLLEEAGMAARLAERLEEGELAIRSV